MTMTVARISLVLPVGAAIFLLGGCTEPIGQDRDFTDENEVRIIDRFAKAQVTAGARHDATLYDSHFDGDTLNELGRQKLDLITADAGTGRRIIYLNVDPDAVTGLEMPRDTAANAGRDNAADRDAAADREEVDARVRPRVDAVTQYLVDAGLPADQFRTRVGPNPATAHSAAASLAQMKKMESSDGNDDSDGDSMNTGGGFRGNGNDDR